MTGWTAAWIAWLLAFFAIEIPALLDHRRGNTLSEHVWRWCSIRDKGRGYRLRRTMLLVLLAWLVVHLLTGGEF